MSDSGIHTSSKSDIVLSTRISLARNIDGVPFPVRLNNLEKHEVNSRVLAAANASKLKLGAVQMSSLYPYEAVSLAERHIISPEFASHSDGRMLLISEDEKTVVMLCERDHMRIRCADMGLEPEKTLEAVKFCESEIGRSVKFAFDPKLGFLNQNPRDIGTGMRVSVLMHLPALSRTGVMARLSATVAKLGFSVRGSYGDGAGVKGDIYRIVNTVTMGISEYEAVDNLKTMALQLATKERAAAEEYVGDINVRDRINRSAGLIKNAVLLTADEMTELLSWVRLGALYGIVNADIDMINKMFVTMQPATLNVLTGQKLPDALKDELRAKTVKQIFGE